MPYLQDNAVVLLHDGHFTGVKDAIKTALEDELGLIDCGLLTTAACRKFSERIYRGEPSIYGGIHMLRFAAARRTDKYRVDVGVPTTERRRQKRPGRMRRLVNKVNKFLGRKV